MIPARFEELKELLANPTQAHIQLFPHRHTDRTPHFHDETIHTIHDLTIPEVLLVTFRGGAKSTLCEEALCILALSEAFTNGIIIGESEGRAAERLTAIKHEIDTNERLHYFFGEQHGAVWGETRALLKNGVYLQAYGRGQSLRGIKFRDARPSFAFLDDIEDEISTKDSAAVDKTMRWVMGVLKPAMDKKHRVIRMAGTKQAPDTVVGRLQKDSQFKVVNVPVWHYSKSGKLRSSWPERFPLDDMLATKDEYERMGMAREFAQEYLCESDTEGTKAFDNTNLPVDPLLKHTFQPTIAIIDPARTTRASSSLTGTAVFSWQSSKLVIWEAEGQLWRPSDIIDHIFELHDKYNLTFIGVEKDGLEEFIMQPLRTEMARRATYLPIVAIKAPRGKLDFIRALQPYLTAGEIVLAQECPALQTQLRNFPSGKIDTLNALAYALRMHPGEPIYTQFSPTTHLDISQGRPSIPNYAPIIFCLSSTSTETAGAALTTIRRRVHVLSDIVVQGAPGSAAPEVLDFLRLGTGRNGAVIIPKQHYEKYEAIGLRASLMAANAKPGRGGDPAKGRAELQQRMEADRFRVSDTATWTLRALTGGFAYDANSKLPRQNSYDTLMLAIESAARVLSVSQEDEGERTYRYTADGRRYLSAKG